MQRNIYFLRLKIELTLFCESKEIFVYGNLIKVRTEYSDEIQFDQVS